MKILILIFILYLHDCSSQYPGNPKKTGNTYPKKVRPGIIQYNNAGKYIKPAIQTVKTKKNKLNSKREYTVFAKPFPTSEENRAYHQIVPDSPYFPVDEPEQPERRARVKKVLPEYFSPVRHKRSADDRDKTLNDASSSRRKARKEHKKIKSSVPESVEVDVGGKKKHKHAPVKTNRLKPAKKRGQLNRGGKKKGVKGKGRKTRSKTGAKNLKLRDSRNQKLLDVQGRINHKPSRPRLSRSKSRNTTLKKRLAQGHRDNTSKLRGARNPKGLNTRRLIAAKDALIEEYPYTISIQKDGNHWCSGAILNPTLIITTANCLWKSSSISRLRVRAGSRHTDRGGQVAKIQEVMKHPGWKLRKNPDNDVALALLDRKIRFSHGVHAVDLPNRVMMPPFDDAWITSWGAERRDGIFDTRSVNLQVYHARLMDRDKCNNVTQRFAVSVSENFICLSQSGTRAPCTRDTGAPAVSDGVLWGLASWGIRKLCGTERFPAMFSYMASQTNMNFIVNATHYLMKEERAYPFLDRFPLRKISITTPTPMTLPYKR